MSKPQPSAAEPGKFKAEDLPGVGTDEEAALILRGFELMAKTDQAVRDAQAALQAQCKALEEELARDGLDSPEAIRAHLAQVRQSEPSPLPPTRSLNLQMRGRV